MSGRDALGADKILEMKLVRLVPDLHSTFTHPRL